MQRHVPQEPKNWRELYVGALFESDRSKLVARIAEARAAIVSRARDLFLDPADHIEEGQALDDALYALDALAHCYLNTTTQNLA
ncbi:MAG TPA: hypothetical protein VFB28_01090 [Terriglobales bacterium]|nr:hypothetical protein [Terriglobales bacterium]